MKSFIYFILGFILIAGSAYFFLKRPVPETVFEKVNTPMETSVITINNTEVEVEIASTTAEQKQGLSGRMFLKEGAGMLFIFTQGGEKGFWMKDMFFPIDIIWVDANTCILGIEKDVSPDSYPRIFYSPTETLYVFEVNAGDSTRLGLQIGDKINFKHK